MNTTPGKPVRDSYYDNLRIFLMYVVVLCHSLEVIRKTTESIIYAHEILLSFCMPLFVFLTGFFSKSMSDAGSPKRMRILNISLLYIIVQLIKMAIANYTSILLPAYGNWFLVGLIAWYLILPLVKKMKPAIPIIFSILFALYFGTVPHSNDIMQLQRVICFFPFFLIGFYVSKEQLEIIKKPSTRVVGLLIFVCVAIFYVTFWSDVTPLSIMHGNKTYSVMGLSSKEGIIMRAIWYILSILSSFGVMCIISRKHNFLTKFGTRTLPIFILHTCLYLYLSVHTNFFSIIASIPNELIMIGVVLLYSAVVTILCGIKPLAKLFDWFMAYDFHWLFRDNNK